LPSDAHYSSASPENSPEPETHARATALYGRLPLLFEANRGQTDSAVKFMAYGSGYRLFLTSDEAVISLHRNPTAAPGNASVPDTAVVRLRMVGARSDVAIAGDVEQEAHSNYFVGNDPSRYVTDVPNYARVRYSSLYPGIDLVYYGNQRQLEYDFVVTPGGDPSKIALAFDGADDVSVDADGNLVVHTALGDITQHRPLIYQNAGGGRRTIDGRYVQRADRTIGIQVAAYDVHKPLIIDPVLNYSTFLGGTGNDYGSAIAVDANGNAYVTGYTASSNFPTAGAYQASLGRSATNIFIAKLNAAGSALVYSTYLGGGSETDYAAGIAIDGAGNAYVTGTTTGSTFPVTTGAYQKGATGGGSFVSKLGAAGNTLVYSTYVLKANAKAIAVDSNNYAYIAGAANSGFTATTGAFQTKVASTTGTNAFVMKLNAAGSAATYSTFLGGSGTDVARGIAVGTDGSAYVGGSTTSANFPVLTPVQATLGGMQDGFVTKLNAAGTSLLYSTYLGGEMDDSVNAIAIDPAGSAYAAGETYSWQFPVTPFAIQTQRGGQTISQQDGKISQGMGFVTKLTSTGDSLAYSTYLSGSYCYGTWCLLQSAPSELPSDAVYGIAVDSVGHAYVTGIVRSPNFPLVDSLITTDIQLLSGQDAMFVTKLSQGGDAALYSTFIREGAPNSGNTPAGLPNDAGKGIAIDGSGSAYGVGEGISSFPTTAGAFKTTNSGGTDAVVFKLSNPSSSSLTLNASATSVTVGQTVKLTATVPGGASTGTVTFRLYYSTSQQMNTYNVAVVNGTATYTANTYGGGIIAVSAIYRNNGSNTADSPLLYLVVNPPAVCN
jgi:hypothetical protein